MSPTSKFAYEEWSQIEVGLADEERCLAMKLEELRQKEAILHIQKINAKKAEMLARQEALREKELELNSLEYEIKGIQTEIAHVRNNQALDRLRTSDHREVIEQTKRVLFHPVVTQVPGETVEVLTHQTKTFTEDLFQPYPAFVSQAPMSNHAFQRY